MHYILNLKIFLDKDIDTELIKSKKIAYKLTDIDDNNNTNNINKEPDLIYSNGYNFIPTIHIKDLIELIDFFNENECSFNSLTESIDTRSSTGRMFIMIIGIFAEFERENIVERVKFGLERKVKEGYTIASKNLSYGYDKDKGEKNVI